MADPTGKITPVVVHDEESLPPTKEIKSADEAHRFVQENEAIEWTDAEERKLLWKLDRRLIVLLLLANVMTTCDSQAYGIAALFGIIQDLKLYTINPANPQVLDLTRYSWTSSILTFGSLASQYPLLLAAQRLPIGKCVTVIVLYSGALALLFLTLHDFAGTMVLRFFYGFQGVSIPVFILLSSMWWKTEEQPLRIGFWMSGASIGAIVGQAFDYAAAHIKGQFAHSPWKWIYLLLGSMTVAYSIIFCILFPDTPMKARFLTERERNIAVRRLQKNHTGIKTPHFKRAQVLAAFTDPQLWLLCVTGFSFSFVASGFGAFGPLILSGFGYDNFKTVQLFMPASGIVIIVMISSGFLGTRFKSSRILIAMLFLIPSIAGYGLLWKLPRNNKGALLASLYISIFFYGALIQTLGLLASNVAGATKKTQVSPCPESLLRHRLYKLTDNHRTANAMVFMISAVGGITGPFAFKGSEASRGYPTGMTILMVFMAAAEVALAVLWLYYRRFNRRRDLAMAAEGAADTLRATMNEEQAAFLDLTEHENPYFRYSY